MLEPISGSGCGFVGLVDPPCRAWDRIDALVLLRSGLGFPLRAVDVAMVAPAAIGAAFCGVIGAKHRHALKCTRRPSGCVAPLLFAYTTDLGAESEAPRRVAQRGQGRQPATKPSAITTPKCRSRNLRGPCQSYRISETPPRNLEQKVQASRPAALDRR
jgi:hypothetical protein